MLLGSYFFFLWIFFSEFSETIHNFLNDVLLVLSQISFSFQRWVSKWVSTTSFAFSFFFFFPPHSTDTYPLHPSLTPRKKEHKFLCQLLPNSRILWKNCHTEDEMIWSEFPVLLLMSGVILKKQLKIQVTFSSSTTENAHSCPCYLIRVR